MSTVLAYISKYSNNAMSNVLAYVIEYRNNAISSVFAYISEYRNNAMPSVLVYVNKYSAIRERREINRHKKMALSYHVSALSAPRLH
jgi:hypothetical protein